MGGIQVMKKPLFFARCSGERGKTERFSAYAALQSIESEFGAELSLRVVESSC